MIPYRDQTPTELVPFVNWLVIAGVIGAWVWLQGAGEPELVRASVETFGIRACEVTGRCAPDGVGKVGLLTSMFMHGSWGHLVGNLLFLWVFGNNVEDSMGHSRYLLFYLLAGLGAAAAQTFAHPDGALPMVGASGAIAGVMGAYIVLYPTSRIHTWIFPIFFVRIPAFLLLGYWIFVQVQFGLTTLEAGPAQTGGVAFWAHIGGFATGMITVKLFEKRELSSAKRRGEKLSRARMARLQW